jgi:glycerol-3-phosphate acyltransferase PlsY
MNTLISTAAGALLCVSIILLPPFTALTWGVFLTWWLFRFDIRIIAISLAFLTGITIAFSLKGYSGYTDSMLTNLFFLLVIALEVRIADHIRHWRNTRRIQNRTPLLIDLHYSPYILDLRDYRKD